MLTGVTAKEAARELHLSPRTVEQHLNRMREKVGATNIVHLVSLVYGIGK